LEDISCHTFRTQSADQALIIITDVCPKHAVSAYGSFIRQSLSQCPEEAAEYAKRLGYVLEASWKPRSEVTAIDTSYYHREL
jgi:hypothetical protein